MKNLILKIVAVRKRSFTTFKMTVKLYACYNSIIENLDLNKLISTATENSDEGWRIIDDALAKEGFANQRELLPWAKEIGVNDINGFVRDLAVSILEKSKQPLDEKTKDKLTQLMQSDTNRYVQFRSSFTLFNKGIKTPNIIAKMKDALTDPDVKEIAKNYLKDLD